MNTHKTTTTSFFELVFETVNTYLNSITVLFKLLLLHFASNAKQMIASYSTTDANMPQGLRGQKAGDVPAGSRPTDEEVSPSNMLLGGLIC